MTNSSDNITVHTKKYYRVVLESIDSSRDSPDSFALKLSMRVCVTLPRARQVLSRLPHVVKDGLTAAQANKLKSVLEDIGGKARLETHLVTPGGTGETGSDLRSAGAETEGTIVCPRCGWEEGKWATHCSICLRRFRDPWSRSGTLTDRLPEENPLDDQSAGTGDRWTEILTVVKHRQLPILIGVIVTLVLILVLK